MDICPCFSNFLRAPVSGILLIFSSYSVEIVLLALSDLPYLGTSIHVDFVDLMVDHIFLIIKGFNEI